MFVTDKLPGNKAGWRWTGRADDQERGLVRALGIDPRAGRRTLVRVAALALRHRLRFAVALGACAGAALFNLAIPSLLGRSVDQVARTLGAAGSDDTALLALAGTAGLLLAANAGRGLLQMIAGYQAEYVGQSVGRDLRLSFFDKLQTLDFRFHDGIHSGDLITRGMLDLEGVRGFLEVGLLRIVQLALLVGIGGWLMLSTDLLLGATTLACVPVVGWLAGRMGLKLRLAWTRLQERMAILTRVMEENLQGARVVRVFPARDHQMRLFDAAADDALALANRRIRVRARSMAEINSVYFFAMLLVIAVGGHRVQAGIITIGELAAFLAYMTILQMPVRQISMIMNASARAMSSGARLFEILDREPAIRDAAAARPLGKRPATLTFDRVTFRYDDGADVPPTLRDVSFTLRAGKTLGIVGPSGSGKSTIAQLLVRFYDVEEGRILIDGEDIRDVTLASLRHRVGLVQQDVFLFDDSVERNIVYANPTAERLAMEAAAEIAQLHDHVSALPAGYRTLVGERGAGLSGGQRQRAAIARGLVAGPSILVFDDSTSAVDAATEHALRHALRDATQDKATIIISHRLSSLMHADEILVLDRGAVLERGNHASLLALGGYYATLHALQTGGEDTAPYEAERERVTV